MIKYILLFLLSTTCISQEPLKIVILDTGLDLKDPRFNNLLCKDVQGIDFTGEGIEDVNGHGTHVTGLIKKYADNSNYCLTIIKYYKDDNLGEQNLKNIVKALTWIAWAKPDFVNFSGGGNSWSDDEASLIRKTPTTNFIVSAGNDNNNLDTNCNYYPACYKLKNIYRVGSLNILNKKTDSSNFGSIINFWQIGENVKSTLPDQLRRIYVRNFYGNSYSNWKNDL